MRGSLPLFRFRGIQLLVHWTFLLLPAYVIYTGYSEGQSLNGILEDIGMVLIVFVCVVLHEFGHALTAQHFGVGTRDITLLPIGGVASLERMPEDPKQEFWITVAGPMVNLVIAGLAFLVLALSGIGILMTDLFDDLTSWNAVLYFLFWTNIGLFLFNLIPAFPMDGGRILRSALSMRLPRARATAIATTVGRVLAVGFVVYGLFSGSPSLAVIGVFIFMAAGSEARTVKQRAQLHTATVRQLMQAGPVTMPSSAGVQNAWNAITMVDQRVLIIMDQGIYQGIVLREDLRTALAQGMGSITSLVQRMPGAAADGSAFALFQQMLTDGVMAMPVTDVGTIVGTIHRLDLEKALGVKAAPAA